VILLLVAAQLLLPRIAAHVARDRVARYGTVLSARVKASPAIKLLWGSVDSATVKAGSLRMSTTQAVDLLGSVRGIDELDLSVQTLTLANSFTPTPLKLHDVTMSKRGAQLYVTAQLSAADLSAALQGGLEVQPIASGGGEIQVRASGGLFGVQTTVRALVEPQEGKLVAQPEGFPLAGLAQLTLFFDPRLAIEGVGLSVSGRSADGTAAEYQLRLHARLE
jgi:hypothetical protein